MPRKIDSLRKSVPHKIYYLLRCGVVYRSELESLDSHMRGTTDSSIQADGAMRSISFVLERRRTVFAAHRLGQTAKSKDVTLAKIFRVSYDEERDSHYFTVDSPPSTGLMNWGFADQSRSAQEHNKHYHSHQFQSRSLTSLGLKLIPWCPDVLGPRG
jgi:hypothetical protein